jgi:hypothetical protein
VDGVDDLGAIDPSQVGGGDPKVCVSELPLYDDQGDAFARHLDGVGVPELMWGESPSDAGLDGSPAKLGAEAGG